MPWKSVCWYSLVLFYLVSPFLYNLIYVEGRPGIVFGIPMFAIPFTILLASIGTLTSLLKKQWVTAAIHAICFSIIAAVFWKEMN